MLIVFADWCEDVQICLYIVYMIYMHLCSTIFSYPLDRDPKVLLCWEWSGRVRSCFPSENPPTHCPRVHHWDGSESNSQRQRWIDTPNWAVYLSEYQLKIFKHHIIYYHYLEGTPIINKPWFMNPELNSKTYWPTVSMLIDVPRRKVELWRSSSVLPSEADVLPTEKGGWPGGILVGSPKQHKTTRKSKRWKAMFAFLLFYRFFRIMCRH